MKLSRLVSPAAVGAAACLLMAPAGAQAGSVLDRPFAEAFALNAFEPAPAPVAPMAEGGAATVTFAGFHVFPDGSSRIFVKMTKQVSVNVNKQGTLVDYVLRDAKIYVANNKNPLITKHFESPVMVARLVPSGSDVVLRVELRKNVETSHRMSRHPDGSATLHVDFPKAAGGGE